MTNSVLQGCRLAASKREAWSVGDIHHNHTFRRKQGHRLGVELETRHVGRGASTTKDVNHKEVDRTPQAGRELSENLASVTVANANGCLLRPRKLGTNKVNEIRFQLHYLLT